MKNVSSTLTGTDVIYRIELQNRFSRMMRDVEINQEISLKIVDFLKENFQFANCFYLKPEENLTNFSKDIPESTIEFLNNRSNDEPRLELLQQSVLSDGQNELLSKDKSLLYIKVVHTGEDFGTLVCYAEQENFFTDQIVCLIYGVVELAAMKMFGLFQKEKINSEKKSLEILLDHKNQEVENALSTITGQFAEVQRLANKSKVLLKEVHHRVNNNLQIINSIIKLYINTGEVQDDQALFELMGRIYTMSLIHMNIMKSVELDRVHLNSYLDDLTFHLKGQYGHSPMIFEWETEVEAFSLDTLVPLGLLLNEMVCFVSKREMIDTELNILLQIVEKEEGFLLTFTDNSLLPYNVVELADEGSLLPTLIVTLVEQLEGTMTSRYQDGMITEIFFKEL